MQAQPGSDISKVCRWAYDVKHAFILRLFDGYITHPHFSHTAKVGRDVHIDLGAGIVGAQLCFTVIDFYPSPGILVQIAKMKLNDCLAPWEFARIDPAIDIRHQHLDIQLIVSHLAACPTHAPFTDLHNDRIQFSTGLGKLVFVSALFGGPLA